MSHHAPLPGPAGTVDGGSADPAERERALPPRLQDACDALFTDADRHGPRSQVLVARIVPAVAALVVALGLTVAPAWRDLLVGWSGAARADLLLAAPVLVALVALGAAMAPLARISAIPLVGVGLALLATGGAMVVRGAVVAGVLPTTIGALLVGVAAARLVHRAVWALPLLLAAGASDAHSVSSGITDRLLADLEPATSAAAVAAVTSIPESQVSRIDLLVLHVPVATGTWMLGIVDVLAIGLLLGLAHLFWLPLVRTAAALGAALLVAVAAGGAVPVLPLLGVAWVLVHARLVWRSTRFSLRRLTYLGG